MHGIETIINIVKLKDGQSSAKQRPIYQNIEVNSFLLQRSHCLYKVSFPV